jgi:putative adenylate-forming enzyme
MKLALAIEFLQAYRRAQRCDGLRSRQQLESLQHTWLQDLRREIAQTSAFYREYVQAPWAEWPIIEKREWMTHFDRINTVGARLEEVSAIALDAERTRDFSRQWRGHTVGMSSGTSGHRGIFLVSQTEGALWAGTLLGKLLRRGLLARERIALILRAGATLYETVGALRLQFRFFDQARPWHEIVNDLEAFAPTILIAPASALRLLGEQRGSLRPRRIISVAEVLDALDRERIERGFGLDVEEIYQATEGLLGISCERGTMHLNEPYIFVEREWQDAQHTRFIPVVTDLWRRTQPIIRYRLNDVLHVRPEPCECGRASAALVAIEGRADDVLWLAGVQGEVAVFPDLITRTILTSVPHLEDFRVVECARGYWNIALRPLPDAPTQQRVIEQCNALARRLCAAEPAIELSMLTRHPVQGKQRRIVGLGRIACAS